MIAPVWLWAVAGEAVLLGIAAALLGRPSYPWVAGLLGVLGAIGFDLAVPSIPAAAGPFTYLLPGLIPLALALFFLRGVEGATWASGGFRILPGTALPTIGLAAALAAVFLLFSLEPGILYGFLALPAPDIGSFAVLFLGAPLLALGQEALYRGYALGRLADTQPFRIALFASSALFALSFLAPRELLAAGAAGAAQILFLQVVPEFVLGILLGLFFYKGGWSLLGPWLVRTALLWIGTLLPVGPGNAPWEILFVFSLIALSAMIMVLQVGLVEPRFRQRRYLEIAAQPLRRTLLARARSRRQTRNALLALGAVVLLVAAAAPIGNLAGPSPIRLYAIASGSMEPTFSRGTLVAVVPVAAPSDLRTGEIIAYTAPYLSPNGPVVHRIVDISRNGSEYVFTTRGDANPSPDPRPVLFSQVVGRVAVALPLLGYLLLSPPLLVGLLALAFLVALYRSSPPGTVARLRRPVLPRGEGDPTP